jgi:hypothetical protein
VGHAPDLFAHHATVLPVSKVARMRELEVEHPDGHRLVFGQGVDE